MLESRLDNIVYRMGFATTRRAARQLVNHGHILVDGKKVDIPSYALKPGMVVEVAEKDKNKAFINDAVAAATSFVDFVEVDKDAKKGKYVRYPERAELFKDQPINELLIVEYYNRIEFEFVISTIKRNLPLWMASLFLFWQTKCLSGRKQAFVQSGLINLMEIFNIFSN